MKIALIGYGKMGHAIEQQALLRSHEIVAKIDNDDHWTHKETLLALQTAEVAIEFSSPKSCVNNILHCFDLNLPVVVGTTGWDEHLDHIREYAKQNHRTLFYAANYSLGVNLFFRICATAEVLMRPHSDYQAHIEETHHTHKLDQPSGTAIRLAEMLMNENPQWQTWKCNEPKDATSLHIEAFRRGDVVGDHSLVFESLFDTIELRHNAHSRESFASGALDAAQWVYQKKGIFTMNDLLNDRLAQS